MPLRTLMLDELVIDDERSFRHVALYGRLKEALRRSRHRFQIPADGAPVSWDRALFLNLTFWSDADEASVLCDDHIAPDVVAHTAWHHLAAGQLARTSGPGVPCAAALFFSEAIASAFDLYLVGRLLENAPESEFITTQVPILAEAAEQAGLPEAGFTSLLRAVCADPERAFEDMRALLVDVGGALMACRDAREAAVALQTFVGHRFEPLLHHFQLSNWILYARAYAPADAADAADAAHVAHVGRHQAAIAELDKTLREAPVSLDWLAAHWLVETRPSVA